MKKKLYKILFVNQEKVYEVYARKISQGDFFGFVAVEELVFGETSSMVVDPGQEKLKSEFCGVKCTNIPMHSIIRIDEVEKEGIAKMTQRVKDSNVSQFPQQIYTKSPDNLN